MSTADSNTNDLSQGEIEQRVAILKRFRELLLEQRNRFRDYLEVLDKQQDMIRNRNTEALLAHVDLEEKIVNDIFTIQKVIDPLEDMYRAGNADQDGEVPNLKAALDELKAEAIARSSRNRDLLSQHMAELRSEIKTLRQNPFSARRSVYDNSGSASLVDIKG